MEKFAQKLLVIMESKDTQKWEDVFAKIILTRVRIYLKGDTSLEAVDICLKSEEEFPK